MIRVNCGEWYEFRWGMIYGAALALVVFLAFVLAVGYGGFLR